MIRGRHIQRAVYVHGLTLPFLQRMSGVSVLNTYIYPLDLVGSKIMTVYVAEIEGRGTGAFHANNGSDAKRRQRFRIRHHNQRRRRLGPRN
jgi:hypothetical protein